MNTKLILAALTMSLSLAACGQRDEAPDVTTEPAPATDPVPAETPPTDTMPMDETTPPADTMEPGAMEGDTTEPEPEPAQ